MSGTRDLSTAPLLESGLLAKLEAERASTQARIEKLQNTEMDAETKAARIASFQSLLKIIEQKINAATPSPNNGAGWYSRFIPTFLRQDNTTPEDTEVNTLNDDQPQMTADNTPPEEKQAVTSTEEKQAAPNSRDWFMRFKKQVIIPTLLRYNAKHKANDKDVRLQFILLAKKILAHYQTQQEDTKNLLDYIEAIEIAHNEFCRLKKTTLGYANLIPLAWTLLTSDANEEPKLPGALGLALTTLKRHNEAAKTNPQASLITVNCAAERDFVLLTTAFLNYFILNTPKIIFDSWAVNKITGFSAMATVVKAKLQMLNNDISQYEATLEPPAADVKTITNNHDSEWEDVSVVAPKKPLSVLVDQGNSPIHEITATNHTAMLNEGSQTSPAPASTPRKSVEAPATSSFWQRHKKKILWGVGIGVFIGLSIVTAGIITGVAAGLVASVGLLGTIGIGAGATAAGAAVGASVGATSGMIADCCETPAEPASPTIPYAAMTDGWNIQRIHQQARMPIAKPQQASDSPENKSIQSVTQTRTIVLNPQTGVEYRNQVHIAYRGYY